MKSIEKCILSLGLLFVLGIFPQKSFSQAASGNNQAAAPPASTTGAAPAPKPQSPVPPAQQQNAGQAGIKFLWDYSRELGLSKTQLDQMQQAFATFQKQIIQLKAKLSMSEIDLDELMNKNADMKLIQAQVQKSASVQGDMRFAEIKLNRAMFAIMTPDQVTKWKKILLSAQAQTQAQAK